VGGENPTPSYKASILAVHSAAASAVVADAVEAAVDSVEAAAEGDALSVLSELEQLARAVTASMDATTLAKTAFLDFPFTCLPDPSPKNVR
jgi:hypothetical protein